MTTTGRDDVADAPHHENIILEDQPISVTDDDGAILLEALCDLVAEAESWQQPAIALWSTRSQGRSNMLYLLRRRLDRWQFGESSGFSLRLAPKGDVPPRRRRDAAVRTRLSRAWIWRRAGLRSQRLPEYDIVPAPDAAELACTVAVDIRAFRTLDDIRSALARAILGTISARLRRPEAERLWFDLNLRRTDPAKLRRRILASYLPQSLGGATVAALVVCAVLVLLGRRLIAPGSTLAVTDVVALAGVLATVVGLIVQAKSGRRDAPTGLVAARGLTGPAPGGLLDDAAGGADPYLMAWEQDLIDVLFLAGERTRIAVMVYDLDRCAPEIVAGVIDSVRALPQVLLVAEFDPALVAGQLEEQTPWLAGRTRTDPVAYGRYDRLGWIDLIEEFDVSIRLPRPSATLLRRQVEAMAEGPRFAAPRLNPPPDVPLGPPLRLSVLQASPAVADALHEALGAASARSHHRARALVNLWRFYATLEFRCGRLDPADEERARAIVFLAELVLHMPWLLDLLAPAAGEPAVLRALADACEDDSRWQSAVDGLPDGRAVLSGLRDLLRRCGTGRDLLIDLVRQHV